MWTEAAEWHRICFFQNSFWLQDFDWDPGRPLALASLSGHLVLRSASCQSLVIRPAKVGCHGIFSDWNSKNSVTIEDWGIWQATPSWSKGLNAEVLQVSWSILKCSMATASHLKSIWGLETSLINLPDHVRYVRYVRVYQCQVEFCARCKWCKSQLAGWKLTSGGNFSKWMAKIQQAMGFSMIFIQQMAHPKSIFWWICSADSDSIRWKFRRFRRFWKSLQPTAMTMITATSCFLAQKKWTFWGTLKQQMGCNKFNKCPTRWFP